MKTAEWFKIYDGQSEKKLIKRFERVDKKKKDVIQSIHSPLSESDSSETK